MVKVIIFGIGKYYHNRKKELKEFQQVEVIAFSDNNSSVWHEEIDGVRIISPDLIMEQAYDIILIMSVYLNEIRKQLIDLGIEHSKIKSWVQFRAELLRGKIRVYNSASAEGKEKNILIISLPLNYAGAPMAAVYAALAIKKRGYSVVLSASEGDEKFIEETVGRGITVAICPSYPYIFDTEKDWIQKFDVVLVNTFLMLQSACDVSKICPTLWWVHEAKTYYTYTMNMFSDAVGEIQLSNVNIYAVSAMVKKNINMFLPHQTEQILHYGIPDMALEKVVTKEIEKKLVFAIIGNVCERKAQDIFIKAVRKLGDNVQAEFWIIGQLGNDIFSQEIIKKCASIASIKLLGTLTRAEIYEVFPQIDVVVCTSREDPLPIAMTEGMMFGKICITTDTTGTIEYIQDGENGFIVPVEDVEALKNKMEWIIDNRDMLRHIGANARKTYEKYFTLDTFGEKLEEALIETEKQWKVSMGVY